MRQRTLALVLTDPNRARFFVRQPEAVIRAIAGVSPRFRDMASISQAGALVAFPINRPALAIATPKAALLLGRPGAVPLDWLLTAIKTTTNPDTLRALGAGLEAVPAKLSDSQAKEAVEPFLAAIKGTTKLDALSRPNSTGNRRRPLMARLSRCWKEHEIGRRSGSMPSCLRS